MKVKVINLRSSKIVEMDSNTYFTKLKKWVNSEEYSLMVSIDEIEQLESEHRENIEELRKYRSILNVQQNNKNNSFNIEELHGKEEIGKLDDKDIETESSVIEHDSDQTIEVVHKKRGRKPKSIN